jgi:hypothetical protein
MGRFMWLDHFLQWTGSCLNKLPDAAAIWVFSVNYVLSKRNRLLFSIFLKAVTRGIS